jgi:hypothetical protein
MSETAWLRVKTNTLEELIEQHNAMFRRRGALRAQLARLDAAVEAWIGRSRSSTPAPSSTTTG